MEPREIKKMKVKKVFVMYMDNNLKYEILQL